MKARDAARFKAKELQSDIDWQVYRALRNKCKTLAEADKRRHFQELFDKNKKDMDVSTLQISEKSTRVEMDFFKKKVNDLIENLPETDCDPTEILRRNMEQWGDKDAERDVFQLKEISLIETVDLIKSLGNAFDHDGLDAVSMKLVAPSIYIPIQHIINLSLKTSVFANKWKIGQVIPLHKGKNLDKTKTSSYCPISLLPVISKLVERTVQKQMLKFMSDWSTEFQ